MFAHLSNGLPIRRFMEHLGSVCASPRRAACALANAENEMSNDPIVELAELQELGSVRALDARGIGAFEQGHAGRAVRVPIEVWEPKARSTGAFDDIGFWQEEIENLRIGPALPALIYDDGRMIEASRVWFILQHFGVQAFILNGGWPVIQRNFDAIEAAPLTAPAEAFTAQPGAGAVHLIDRSALKGWLNSHVGILDARTVAEFDGADLRQNSRGGHLPGSRMLPHAQLLEDGLVRSADALAQLLADAGVDQGAALVTLCDAGGRAALAAAAALRAGYTDVHIYYPSFSDWARDQSCPVVHSESIDVGQLSA